MTGSAYNWIGVGVGSICVLLAGAALLSEVQARPLDLGSIGFAFGFAFFWAVIAASCGYALMHTRGKAVGSGCLFIVLVVGALLLLTGATQLIPRIAEAQHSDRLEIAVFWILGFLLTIPSALLLWHRRQHNLNPEEIEVRLWQGVVTGVLIVFVGGAVIVTTTGDPYEIGLTPHLVLGGIMVLGAALIAYCGAVLWRGRGRWRRTG